MTAEAHLKKMRPNPQSFEQSIMKRKFTGMIITQQFWYQKERYSSDSLFEGNNRQNGFDCCWCKGSDWFTKKGNIKKRSIV